MNTGSQLNGKYKIAILGWSNASFCNGEGTDSNAVATIFNKRQRQIMFQARIMFLLSTLFVKPNQAIKGAEIPEKISKFLPSIVMPTGTALCRKSINKPSSTGMRTMFNQVMLRKGKLSINALPAVVRNNNKIISNGGRIPNTIIFGGIEFIVALYTWMSAKPP